MHEQEKIESAEGTEIARYEAPAQMMSLAPRSLTEAMESAKLLAASGLCPQEYRGKPADVLAAIIMGSELGITPFQSLQNIAVINGRPSMWGDLVLGLVRASGLLEYMKERDPAEALENREGRCEIKRKGDAEPIVRTFSMDEAETAGLIDRSRQGRGNGPWITYPGRMLQMRARSWAIRDTFPDVLKGLYFREEAADLPDEGSSGPRVVSMPRRASEPVDVDGFLADAGKVGAPSPQQHSASRPARQNAAAPQAEDSAWRGILNNVHERQGTSKGKEGKDRPWVRFDLETSGGTFSTFDTNIRDAAAALIGTEVAIHYSVTDKGYKVVSSIAALDVDE